MFRRWGPRIFVMAFAVLAGLVSAPAQTDADGLFVEGGPGIIQSLSTEVVILRYQKEASPLFGHTGFYEGVYAYWNGEGHAADVALARGLRWTLQKDDYFSAALGAGYIDRETVNLGTHFELYFRLAVGKRTERYDISFGYVHISNGKLIMGWRGADNGENFVTLAIGGLF